MVEGGQRRHALPPGSDNDQHPTTNTLPMLVSTAWLSRYVDAGLDAEALAGLLTLSGLEVEGVEVKGASVPDGVVVGRVLTAEKHPDADRLTLCTVDVGSDAALNIVCGAPNVAAGQTVCVATVGTTLLLTDPKTGQKVPVTMAERKIRGAVSQGMICAEDELGLSGDHAGILVLDDAAPVGVSVRDYLGAGGAVLDVNITPNRPDATSHVGVARDVAALTGAALVKPDVAVPATGGETAERVSVQIDAPEGCTRYTAMIVEDVTVGPSPDWLREALEAVGIRSINNVVDVTNFVLHEIGQPLHAFDFDQLAGHRIRVRRAEAGERFTTLDGKERTLPAGATLICDAERPVALAGIMGGLNSEVTDATTTVLLESAHFDPATTRRTAKTLDLSTDAAYRFERGVDPLGTRWAAARAAALIADVAGGRVVGGCVDEVAVPFEPSHVRLRLGRIPKVLGVDVPRGEAVRLLRAIGFVVEEASDLVGLVKQIQKGAHIEGFDDEPDTLRLTVPSWRPDVTREIDVIEEVARLYGFDRLPEPKHVAMPLAVPVANPAVAARTRLRDALVGLGFREIVTTSLLAGDVAERFRFDHPAYGPGPVVPTYDPARESPLTLRPSLLPATLAVVGYNQRQRQPSLRMFDIGHVFRGPVAASQDARVAPSDEREHVAILLAGDDRVAGWDGRPRPFDVFDAKGTVEALLEGFGLAPTFEPCIVPGGLVDDALTVRVEGEAVGLIGRFTDAALDGFGARGPVVFADLRWDVLAATVAGRGSVRYAPFSRLPEAERDLAFVVPAGTAAGDVAATIRQHGGPLLRGVRLFDRYDKLDGGRVSLAFALRFGKDDGTLRDADLDAATAAVRKAVETAHGAALRA